MHTFNMHTSRHLLMTMGLRSPNSIDFVHARALCDWRQAGSRLSDDAAVCKVHPTSASSGESSVSPTVSDQPGIRSPPFRVIGLASQQRTTVVIS